MLPQIDELDEKFLTGLNEDIRLVPDEYNATWDMYIDEEQGDIENVTGLQSLHNAIVILILTRYGELTTNPLYAKDFGCKIHELPKDNISKLSNYKVKTYIQKALEKMRRIKKINYVDVTTKQNGYDVLISVVSINDEEVKVQLGV